jgi:hypothetical protein
MFRPKEPKLTVSLSKKIASLILVDIDEHCSMTEGTYMSFVDHTSVKSLLSTTGQKHLGFSRM